MSIAKRQRRPKRQMGQFLTPAALAQKIVAGLDFRRDDKVLEPSLGAGAFILPLIERFMGFYSGDPKNKLRQVLRRNLYGAELDENLLAQCLLAIKNRWGELPAHNFVRGDFLLTNFLDDSGRSAEFDWVVGNPPFGGTLDRRHEDALDKKYGFRGGAKIKKETYSFFIVKSMESLRSGGRLRFICSDTFLTINTMKGLRDYLFCAGRTVVENIPFFSEETSQKTVLLSCDKGRTAEGVMVGGNFVAAADIRLTPNHSWRIGGDMAKYFGGPKIGDYMTASSGMTVGKNELFVRDIVGGEISEPFDFHFYQKPITLTDATARARLGKIAPVRRQLIARQEAAGETERAVEPRPKAKAEKIKIPHPDYRYYNKAQKGVVYAPPEHVIFWRDDGDAVYAHKNGGNWYLRGVGGRQYFFREGLTWNLVSTKLCPRWLPPGYVLDSGAPCAFLKTGVGKDEMFFILAWALSDLCNDILKTAINHTKNIQGKDFERLPYPFWVGNAQKNAAVRRMKNLIAEAKAGRTIHLTDPELVELSDIFSGMSNFHRSRPAINYQQQVPLLANRAAAI